MTLTRTYWTVSPDDYYQSTDPDFTNAFLAMLADVNSGAAGNDIVYSSGRNYNVRQQPIPIITRSVRMYTDGTAPANIQLGAGQAGFQFGWVAGHGLNYISLENFNLTGGDPVTGLISTPYTSQADALEVLQGFNGQITWRNLNISQFGGNGMTIGGASNYFGLIEQCNIKNCGGQGWLGANNQASVCAMRLCSIIACGGYGICFRGSGWTFDRCQGSYTNDILTLWNFANTAAYANGATTINLANTAPYNTVPSALGNPKYQLFGPGIQPGTYALSMTGSYTITLSQPTTAAGIGSGLSLQFVATDATWTTTTTVQFSTTQAADWMIGRPVGDAANSLFTSPYTCVISAVDSTANTATLSYAPKAAGSGLYIGPAGAGITMGYGSHWIDFYSEPYYSLNQLPGTCDLVRGPNDQGNQIDISGWNSIGWRLQTGAYTPPYSNGTSTNLANPANNLSNGSVGWVGHFMNITGGNTFTADTLVAKSLSSLSSLTVNGGWLTGPSTSPIGSGSGGNSIIAQGASNTGPTVARSANAGDLMLNASAPWALVRRTRMWTATTASTSAATWTPTCERRVQTFTGSRNVAVATDEDLIFNITAASNANLPTAVGIANVVFRFIVTSASTANLTLVSAGGTLPFTTVTPGTSSAVISDGANWQAYG